MTDEKPAEVPETQKKCAPAEEKPDNNLTLSTKLSTEQLICKTPQESPNSSVKSLKHEESKGKKVARSDNHLLYLGGLQILLGLLMTIFGVLVILYDAILAQLGGGLWGGCLAITSGIMGITAAAKDWCPLKSNAQRVAHTAYLALSLICIAVSQLVLVLSATGIARDISRSENNDEVGENRQEEAFFSNYLALLFNVCLLIVSGLECICAAIASYRSARILCSCFRGEGDASHVDADAKDAFVSSWLGKHTSLPPPLYVVAASSAGRRNKLSNALAVAPVLSLPPPVLPPPPPPPILSYPLIPAPLGSVPSPLIRPHPKEILHHKYRRYRSPDSQIKPTHEKRKKAKTKPPKKKSITTEEVVRTYTGLDRTIAEEFIQICDSRNTSLCSDSSCQSSCQSCGCNGSQSSCTCTSNTSGDASSRDVKL